jgi:hypothetical protein
MWRLSGLHRHVTLRSVAASASIGDVRVTTPLEWSSSSNTKSTSSAPGHAATAAAAAVTATAAVAGSAGAAEGGGPASALTKAQLCVEVLLEVDTHHLYQQQQQEQQGSQQQSSLLPPAAAGGPTGEGAPGAPCGLRLEVVLMSAEGEVLVPAVTAAWEQVRGAV